MASILMKINFKTDYCFIKISSIFQILLGIRMQKVLHFYHDEVIS